MRNEDLKMDFHRQVEDRRIRSETIDRLVALLTKNAREPERIGQRVLVMEFILSREKGFPVMKDLAQRMGVSPARASQAVAAMYEEIEAARNVNGPLKGNDEKP
jgi:hypothetical protein